MSHKFFKKFSSIVFVVLMASILMANAALAAPETPAAPAASAKPRKAKVYLNEPIGAGKEVFHVTKCEKIPKMLPLRCNNITAVHEDYRRQCMLKDEKTGEEKIEIGKYIQRCTAPAANIPPDSKECKKQEFVKAKVWAVIGCSENPCDSHERYSVLEYLTTNGRPDLESRTPYSTEKNNETFEDKYSGYEDLDVQAVYEIGSNTKGESSCKTGDFEVNSLDLVPGSGTLTLGDLAADMENFKECGSRHQSLIGDNNPAINCSRVELIESDSGTGLLSEFIGAIYRWAAGIIGVIAVLVIVISGIQISAAGGDSAKVDEAKNRIMGSIAGLVLLFLSGLLLYTINPTFFTAT